MLRKSFRIVFIAASAFFVYLAIYWLPASVNPTSANAAYPSYPTPIGGYPTLTPTPTNTPTGIPLTPAAPATKVIDNGNMVIELTSVPTPSGGVGVVRLAVAVAVDEDLPPKVSVLRPLKSLFVSLTTDGVANHEDLPQPARITIKFAVSDLPTGADPLKVVLFLVAENGNWEQLSNLVVAPLGGGLYAASGTAPHFSFITLGLLPPVYIPSVFKAVAESSW